MAKPVDHNGFTSVTTAGVETGKGVIKAFGVTIGVPTLVGALAVGALGALALGGIVAVGAAVAGATLLGASVATGIAALIGGLLGGAVGGAAGATGGTVASVIYAGPIAAVGAALGLYKGGQRIEQETQAYRNHGETRAQQLNDAAQAGFAQGVQAGQQQVVQQLQQMQYAAIQQQMDGAGKGKSFADKVTQAREAQAAAQPTR